MKTKTEVIFILDRSGSMYPLVNDTIGSFNGLIEKQKEVEGEAYITTVLFNQDIKTIHRKVPIEDLEPLKRSDYNPNGVTALLDAVGDTIIQTKFSYNDLLREDRPDNVMIVIITDGMENASHKYDATKVKNIISEVQERYGWEVLFVGANIDAIKEGSKIGIRKNRSVNYHADQLGTDVVYNTIEKTIKRMRVEGKIEEDWDASIRDDFTNRK